MAEAKEALEKETTNITPEPEKKPSALKRFGHWYVHRKRYSLPLTVLLLAVIVLAIPASRYAVAGGLWRQAVVVTVTDSQTGNPVSQAAVTVADKQATTDKNGQATVGDVPAGVHSVAITKPHYKDSQLEVEAPFFRGSTELAAKLEATGRVVELTVHDRIAKKPLANALVDAGGGVQAKTSEDGTASLVIAPNATDTEVVVTLDGYNQAKTTVQTSGENATQLTPRGQVYFLSKRSGTIDVVRTNLDGTSRKVVVAGTGNEDDRRTSLLASRDWKYLALYAKRGDESALYLIDTATGKLETMDEGKELQFTLVGWSGHRFLYEVEREKPGYEAGAEALKSYYAPGRQLDVIDSNAAGKKDSYDGAYDATSQNLHSFYILKNNQIVYVKSWNGEESRLGNHQTEITSISASGDNQRTLKAYSAKKISNIEAKLYTPQEIHFRVWDNNYKRLENVMTVNGAIVPVPPAQQKFDQDYPTFLISPNGKRAFWSEPRDGKNVLFVGDDNATAGTKEQLTNLAAHAAYGWVTDDYVLLQKDGSELYITTLDQLKNNKDSQSAVKISDYHKAATNFAGYGYGYGGL